VSLTSSLREIEKIKVYIEAFTLLFRRGAESLSRRF